MSYDSTILAESTLVHYYPLNESVGATTVVDNKGAMNSSSVSSGLTFGGTGGCADGSSCVAGLSISNRIIQFASPPPWPTSGDLTIEFGMNMASGTVPTRVIAELITFAAELLTNSSRQLKTASGLDIGPPIPTAAWHYYQVVLSGSSVSWYVDGVLSAGPTSDTTLHPSSLHGLELGDNSGGNSTSLQKVAFYTSALNTTQITHHYNAWAGINQSHPRSFACIF